MAMLSPYPGLRPFHLEEHDLFFGREEQVDELLLRLRDTRFLAVVGASGCGKSSLARAGMMAALETGYLVTAGSGWRFAVMRPGSRPIHRLAEALIAGAGLVPAGLDAGLARELIEDTLGRGPRGLVEVLDGAPLPADTNLLVLVDQFEEMFRFRREGNRDEADAFVALLLESAEQQDQPVYVVITMRSDFFGDCAVFTDLPEAINKSQYLTPRLTREQREAAIVGPARVFGGDVEPQLVNRLLNEMGSDPDQLPLLQHLLMRMWTWRGAAATSCSDWLVPVGHELSGERGGEGRTLTMDDYESVGGIANALSNHAEEAFTALSESQRTIAEIMFRRLSERGPNNRDIRRPTPAGEIATLAGISVDEVVQVVDVFRAAGCSFLVPPCPETIYPRSVVDITHESFLRQWQRLKGWIDAEAKSVESYRFLEQNARHWKQKRAALWGTPNLELALAWREEERPTAEWAKRYGGDFTAAMEFLTASENAKRAELARKEAIRKASVRRLRWAAAIFASLSVLLAGSWGYYWYEYSHQYVAYYNTFIKKWGIAEGYGELTDAQRRARAVSLKVVRDGHSGPVLSMEAVDASGRCSTNHLNFTVLEFNASDSPTHQECRWEFVRDARGNIAYELAYNQFNNFVRGLAYTPKTLALGERRAYFVNAQGSVAPLKNSHAEIIEFAYSSKGYETRLSYFDRDGNPQPGRDLAYSQGRSYTSDGLLSEMVSLDGDEKPMNDNAGNARLVLQHDSLGNPLIAEALDKDGNKVTTTEGWQRFEATYDGAGNLTEEKYFNALGGPAAKCTDSSVVCNGSHRIVYNYNERGFLEDQSFYGTSNQPVVDNEHKYHLVKNVAFDGHGNVVEQRFYGVDGKVTTDEGGCHAYKMRYNNFGQNIEIRCFGLDHQPGNKSGYHKEVIDYDRKTGNIISRSFYSVDGMPTLHKDGYHRVNSLHDARGNVTDLSYFDEHDRPIDINGGYHRSVAYYNALGQKVQEQFFRADGGRAITRLGFYQETTTYDERGHAMAFAYFGPDGQPVRYDSKYHKAAIKNDEQGHVLEIALYDEKDALIMADGYAVLQTQRDIRGNILELRHLGTRLEPVADRDTGCHVLRAEYDDRNQKIMSACYDSNDRLARGTDGFARWTKEYDANGNETEMAYFGEDGRLRMQPEGYAKVTRTYDKRGNQGEVAFYDESEKLVLQKAGYARWTKEYDANGNETEVAYFDEHDRLVLGPDGYAKIIKAFDDNNNEIELVYFGEDGRLRMQPEGYAKVTRRYDERGNRIEVAFYDESEKLVLQKAGYARWTKEYDQRNNEVYGALYGADNKPILYDGQFARRTRVFDNSDNMVEEAFYDVKKATSAYSAMVTHGGQDGLMATEIK